MTSCWEICHQKVVTCSFLLVLWILIMAGGNYSNHLWFYPHEWPQTSSIIRKLPITITTVLKRQLCVLRLCCAYWAVLSIWCSLTLRPLVSLNFPAVSMYINLRRKCPIHLGPSVFNFLHHIEHEVSRFSMRNISQLVTTDHRTFLCASTILQSCAYTVHSSDLCSLLHINHGSCKMKTCSGKQSITCRSSQVKTLKSL